jgi:hypothetical protein
MEISEWYSLCFHVGNAPIYPNLSCCLFGWIGFFIGFVWVDPVRNHARACAPEGPMGGLFLTGLIYLFVAFILLYIYMGFIQA